MQQAVATANASPASWQAGLPCRYARPACSVRMMRVKVHAEYGRSRGSPNNLQLMYVALIEVAAACTCIKNDLIQRSRQSR